MPPKADRTTSSPASLWKLSAWLPLDPLLLAFLADELQALRLVCCLLDVPARLGGQITEPFDVAFHGAQQPNLRGGRSFFEVAVQLQDAFAAFGRQGGEGSRRLAQPGILLRLLPQLLEPRVIVLRLRRRQIGEGEQRHAHRLPTLRSSSAYEVNDTIGRPCGQWPAKSVPSSAASSAFASMASIGSPARSEA